VTRTIYRQRIPHWRRPLGRHVNHDSESRRYTYRAAPRELTTVQHVRHVPVLDQGSLGSCTGNAGIGCLGTGRFYTTITGDDVYHTLNEADAVALYSAATRVDPYDGAYPPTDTGSDGLTIAKVLTSAGMIAGYEWAFGLDQTLQALMDRPLITGTLWLDNMFNPTDEGLVRPSGTVAGGHEYVVDGYDDLRGWVWFTNSWGADWGQLGRFAMEAEQYGNLLARDGDVTVFVPATDPPPVPTPDVDHVFAAALRPWAFHRHVDGNARAAKAARAWLWAKGL
jgi:hypothetical protein